VSASRSGARRALPGVLGGLAFACSSGVENPSAFSEERYLCAPELASAWQAERELCRASFELDRGCLGAVSFAGQLQGSSVVVDAPIYDAEFNDRVVADGTWRREEAKFDAESPYFLARFRFTSIGGFQLDANASRELEITRVPGDDPAIALDDSLAHGGLRLTASSQSVESPAEAGNLSITSQSAVEQSGSFTLEFENDAVDGCFYMFTTARLLIPYEDDGQQ
jgi:hypothetical protein